MSPWGDVCALLLWNLRRKIGPTGALHAEPVPMVGQLFVHLWGEKGMNHKQAQHVSFIGLPIIRDVDMMSIFS